MTVQDGNGYTWEVFDGAEHVALIPYGRIEETIKALGEDCAEVEIVVPRKHWATCAADLGQLHPKTVKLRRVGSDPCHIRNLPAEPPAQGMVRRILDHGRICPTEPMFVTEDEAKQLREWATLNSYRTDCAIIADSLVATGTCTLLGVHICMRETQNI